MNRRFSQSIAILLFFASVSTAQGKPGDEIGKAVGQSCFFFCVLPCAGLAVLFAINVALMSGVSADARCRGMDSASWVIVVLLAGPIGYVVYMLSRTSGDLIGCSSCGNGRLRVSARCPHCHNP